MQRFSNAGAPTWLTHAYTSPQACELRAWHDLQTCSSCSNVVDSCSVPAASFSDDASYWAEPSSVAELIKASGRTSRRNSALGNSSRTSRILWAELDTIPCVSSAALIFFLPTIWMVQLALACSTSRLNSRTCSRNTWSVMRKEQYHFQLASTVEV